MGRCNKRQSGSSQRCPETGQETLGDKLNYKMDSNMIITLLYCKGVQAFHQIVQRGCGSLHPGDASNLTGHIPGQSAVQSSN